MAAMTFQQALSADTTWTQVADAASYSDFAIQVESGKVALYVSDAGAPTINQSGYMVLDPGRSSELVLVLPTDQVVYVRALGNQDALVRGYRSPI